MKQKKAVISIVLLLLVMLTGVFLLFFLNFMNKENEANKVEPINVEYFSGHTNQKEFQEIPVLAAKNAKVGNIEEQGGGCFVLGIDGVTVEEYNSYLIKLQQEGFKKHSDNGGDGMEGYVYTTSFLKDNLTVTVSHAIQLDKTYISAAFDLPLSDHLIYKDEYVEHNIEGARTKLHLVQLNNNGTSIVIQLKNGHFVIHDGGLACDAPYLLDYLEELTPGDDKPIIEGWFISHAHDDHIGAVTEIATNRAWAARLIVEGFYYVEPSASYVSTVDVSSNAVWLTTRLNTSFENMNGEKAGMYRPQYGQRYYFCDIEIDVAYTTEQTPKDSYFGVDFNDTSSWLLHNIDGQKFLYIGDSSHTAMRAVMYMYDKTYFDLDVFAVSHHGINVYDYFVEYCIADTLLYTVYRTKSLYEDTSVNARLKEHERMKELAKESIAHGEGTAVLTFPYTVGSYEIMPSFDWRYNSETPGEPYRTIFK